MDRKKARDREIEVTGNFVIVISAKFFVIFTHLDSAILKAFFENNQVKAH